MDNWRPVPGYVGVYWINQQRKVRNAKGTILTPIDDDTIELRNNGLRERHSISALVIAAFEGDTDEH